MFTAYKCLPLLIFIFSVLLEGRKVQKDEPPVVRIVSPSASQQYVWNSQMRYEIAVMDKEDGDSKYNEISSREVLLEVRTISDEQAAGNDKNRKPLQAMMASNCMNCHDFTSKLIGPSFVAIGEKYADKNAVDNLVKSVRDGSKGIWGDIVMPTHHELSEAETRSMVEWILSFSKDKDVSYYIGTEGTLRIKKPDHKTTALQLTATYLDHDKEIGEEKVRIKIKN